mmetsp:Transcript_33959/g.67615  ORF Transcript_33959/g.67615 Transcript_33959/m.67615 type:complete len:220 (-) Transcript_33959:1198-1857(-)
MPPRAAWAAAAWVATAAPLTSWVSMGGGVVLVPSWPASASMSAGGASAASAATTANAEIATSAARELVGSSRSKCRALTRCSNRRGSTSPSPTPPSPSAAVKDPAPPPPLPLPPPTLPLPLAVWEAGRPPARPPAAVVVIPRVGAVEAAVEGAMTSEGGGMARWGTLGTLRPPRERLLLPRPAEVPSPPSDLQKASPPPSALLIFAAASSASASVQKKM